MSKLSDLIEEADKTGDYSRLLSTALEARFRAEDGEYCQCENPVLVDYDLMCGNCFLENRGQIEKRLKRSNNYHKFEPREDLEIMCKICSRWEDDPIHKSRLDPEEIKELLDKGQKLKEDFAREQKESHNISVEELHRVYD